MRNLVSKRFNIAVLLSLVILLVSSCKLIDGDGEGHYNPSENHQLASLTISEGSLSPSFAIDVRDYSVDVDNSVESIQVTATVEDVKATMKINGTATQSGTPSASISLAVGDTAISVVITAEDGSSRTLTITVTRVASIVLSDIADLSNLTISAGDFIPVFSSSTVAYNVSVANMIDSVTLTPTLADANATLLVNSTAVNSGSASSAIALAIGANAIAVLVTAEDGSTVKTYTVSVTRDVPLAADADLSGLSLSTGSLTPSFSSAQLNYTASVSLTTTSITATPSLSDTNASVTVDGVTTNSGTASGSITLVEGENTITVVVLAEDGVTSKNYSLIITREAAITRVVYTTFEPAPRPLRLAEIDNQLVTATSILSDLGWSDRVRYFLISPDGTMVAMTARADGASPYELYVVALTGGTPPVKVSGTLGAGGAVSDFKWSPDSTRIAYRAKKDTAAVNLYVVSADGVTETKVNSDLPNSRFLSVRGYHWAPNSSLIAYTVNPLVQSKYELIISAPDGTGKTIVPILDGYEASTSTQMAWSPDSLKLVYNGKYGWYTNSSPPNKLFIVGADGLSPAYLSAPVLMTSINNVVWAPDGSTIASKVFDSVAWQLMTFATDGSAFTALTNLPSGRGVKDIGWAPDSSLIAYISDRDTDNIYELSVVAPDGSGLVDVSDSLGSTARVFSNSDFNFEWSADSQKLLFIAAPLVQNQEDLYIVSRTGLNPVTLTNRMTTETFWGAAFSPNGTMAYGVWNDGLQSVAYSITLDGSSVTSVIDPSVTDDLIGFQVVDDAGVSKIIIAD